MKKFFLHIFLLLFFFNCAALAANEKLRPQEEIRQSSVEKQDKEIDILQKDKLLREKDIQLRRCIIFSSIGFAFLLLIAAFIFYKQNKKRKIANQELMKKNELITQQKEQLSTTLSKLQSRTNELNKQYRFMQRMMDNIPNPVFYKDTEGIYLGCNKAFEEFSGRTKKELTGNTIFDFANPTVAKHTHEMDKKLINTGELQHYEAEVFSAAKERMDVIYFKSPFYDSQGNIAGLIAVMVDITSMKEYQRELKELNHEKDKYLELLDEELNRAASYVRSLLPEPVHDGNIRTAWRFIPSEQLGGDSFGYHWLDDEHFAVYLLDVSGHGVGSALLSVSVLNVLRFETLANTDFKKPEQVLSGLNSAFRMEEHDDLYFTIFYGVYNINKRELNYCGAAHPPPLLIDENEQRTTLITNNLLIGAKENYTYTNYKTTIHQGSKMYVFSDGAYEVERDDGSFWTLDELYNFLDQHRDGNATEIDQLYQHVINLSKENKVQDDFSMLKVVFV